MSRPVFARAFSEAVYVARSDADARMRDLVFADASGFGGGFLNVYLFLLTPYMSGVSETGPRSLNTTSPGNTGA